MRKLGGLAILAARAGGRLNMPFVKVHGPYNVVFGIRYVERIALQRHALGFVETRGGEITVRPPGKSRTDRFQQGSVQSGDYDAVVVAIGDKQPPAGLVGQNLTGEPQGRGGDLGGGMGRL